MRLNGAARGGSGNPRRRRRLAQKRVANFIEENLAGTFPAVRARRSRAAESYHFLRSFKRSFWRAAASLLHGSAHRAGEGAAANPTRSVTEIAMDVGSAGRARSATFHRIAGQTPTDYRRSLE
jgi:AraC-like DNA-binding protein